MSEAALRQRREGLYLFQEGPAIATKRKALEAALGDYFMELSDRGALHGRDLDAFDLKTAIDAAMESIDNSARVPVKDWILEWLTT